MAATLSPAERATNLLRRHLTPAQRKSYDRVGWFDVLAQDGRTYRLFEVSQYVARVERLGADGNRDRWYCTAPEFEIPAADAILGYLLLLIADVAEFHRAANPGSVDGELSPNVYSAKIQARYRRQFYRTINDPPVAVRRQPRPRRWPSERDIPLWWPVVLAGGYAAAAIGTIATRDTSVWVLATGVYGVILSVGILRHWGQPWRR